MIWDHFVLWLVCLMIYNRKYLHSIHYIYQCTLYIMVIFILEIIYIFRYLMKFIIDYNINIDYSSSAITTSPLHHLHDHHRLQLLLSSREIHDPRRWASSTCIHYQTSHGNRSLFRGKPRKSFYSKILAGLYLLFTARVWSRRIDWIMF